MSDSGSSSQDSIRTPLQSALLGNFSDAITNSLKAFIRSNTNQKLIALISNINGVLGGLLDQGQLLQTGFHFWHIFTSVISADFAMPSGELDVRRLV